MVRAREDASRVEPGVQVLTRSLSLSPAETIVRHFGEFGVLESARVIKAKGIAFVTYTMRCSAEFAKEAMAEQVGSPTG